MSNPNEPPLEVPFLGQYQGHISFLQIGFPNTGDSSNSLCPVELRAVSWPEGKRIDLKWGYPPETTLIVIKRSRVFHPFLVNDESELLYVGPPIEHFIDGKIVAKTLGPPVQQQAPATLDAGVFNTDADLDENTFYYYTVFMTKAVEPVGVLDFGPFARGCMQVTGLSGEDIVNSTRSGHFREWLYHKTPGDAVDQDQKLAEVQGRETGYLQDLIRFQQGFSSLLRNYITNMATLKMPEQGAPGYVGEAVDQVSILANHVKLFGFYVERFIPDISILRRLARNAVELISQKGTCTGIENFIKVLTLWDCTVEVFGQSNCLTSYLKTWDGESTRKDLSYLAGVVTIDAGIVYLADSPLVEDEYAGGIIIDSMGEKYHILSNTPDTITLEDTTAVLRVEDLLFIDVVVALGGGEFSLDLYRSSGGPSALNNKEYVGFQILSSNNVLMDVISNDPATPNILIVSADGVPVGGSAAVAPFYLVGDTYDDREPQVFWTLYTGCPSFLWEPRRNLQLYSEGDPGPFNPLFSGGLLKGNALIPGDLVITIKTGVAEFVGVIDYMIDNVYSETVVYDFSAAFGDAGELANYYLNPNRNQRGLFNIKDNAGISMVVPPIFDGAIHARDIAKIGSNYFVLSIYNAALYLMVVRMMKLMTPRRFFVFFEE